MGEPLESQSQQLQQIHVSAVDEDSWEGRLDENSSVLESHLQASDGATADEDSWQALLDENSSAWNALESQLQPPRSHLQTPDSQLQQVSPEPSAQAPVKASD